MRRAIAALLTIGMLGFGAIAGCRDTPPPPRVPVPTQYDRDAATHTREPVRPLPPPRYEDPTAQPPFDDAPLVSQRPPEQRMFVDAYRAVGSPRITVFINRTPGDYPSPGQYDDVQATAIDYGAVESIMTDWIASNGQVTVISPLKGLQNDRQQALLDAAAQAGADVLISVQARPTKQTAGGASGVRILAEALNTRGGESIGRAVVDVPPPLEKTQINEYTRYLARKLMDDMSESWREAPPPPRGGGEALPPSTSPSDRP